MPTAFLHSFSVDGERVGADFFGAVLPGADGVHLARLRRDGILRCDGFGVLAYGLSGQVYDEPGVLNDGVREQVCDDSDVLHGYDGDVG